MGNEALSDEDGAFSILLIVMGFKEIGASLDTFWTPSAARNDTTKNSRVARFIWLVLVCQGSLRCPVWVGVSY